MGTEIQNKAHFSGSYSTRDVSDNLGNNIRALYDRHKAFNIDHFNGPFLRKRTIDGYSGYEKEQLKQTILKHEFIFKHQLEELHRIYTRQRDLMNEIKRRELQKPSEWSFVDLSPMYSTQSPLNFTKDATFISQERVTLKESEYPEPKLNTFQRSLMNLDLPLSMCMNAGRDTKRDADVYIGSGNDFKSNLCSRRVGNVIDLNEPVQIEENHLSCLSKNNEAEEGVFCVKNGRDDEPLPISPPNKSDTKTRRERTLFGVEISEGNDNKIIANNNKKIFGFSIVVPPCSPSNTSCVTLEANNGDERKGFDRKPSSNGSDLVTGKGLNSLTAGLNLQIDLNLSVNEDEGTLISPLSETIVKIATTEIDLEAPAVLESAFSENMIQVPSVLPFEESEEQSKELDEAAAEAIFAMSSSSDLVKNTTNSDPLSNFCDESLLWFADLVSSYNDNGDCDEESYFIPNGMDDFESMTLNLKETNMEEYLDKYQVFLDTQKDDEKTVAFSCKRPRRGQGKRGKQRKDFQRDVLPGIVSLSRYEVAEDLHSFEEVFKACGLAWQPNVLKRSSGKGGRGRRRSGVCDKVVTPVCAPPSEEPSFSGEVALVVEETAVARWGKRMRRLPRRRCRMGNFTNT